MPLDDDAVDRHHLAGVDHDDVAGLEPVERDLDLDAVAVEPDVPGLLAEGVQEQLLGVVLRPLHQDAAEAQAPAEHRPGEDRHRPQAADDHDRVEHVHPQPLLLEEDLAGLLEGRDRRVGEQARRHGQERRARRTGPPRPTAARPCRAAGGGRACPCAAGCSALGEGRVEDLDDLVARQLPCGSYLTRTVQVSGLVLYVVDPQHAHQLALDRLAEVGLAVEHRVLEPEPARDLVLDLPVGDHRAERKKRICPFSLRTGVTP